MIVEQRIHTLKPGTFPKFMKYYQEEGYPIKRRHFGNSVGHFRSERRNSCQFVQLWIFQDLNERESKRISLMEDTNWQRFARKISPLVKKTEHRILTPTPLVDAMRTGD